MAHTDFFIEPDGTTWHIKPICGGGGDDGAASGDDLTDREFAEQTKGVETRGLPARAEADILNARNYSQPAPPGDPGSYASFGDWGNALPGMFSGQPGSMQAMGDSMAPHHVTREDAINMARNIGATALGIFGGIPGQAIGWGNTAYNAATGGLLDSVSDAWQGTGIPGAIEGVTPEAPGLYGVTPEEIAAEAYSFDDLGFATAPPAATSVAGERVSGLDYGRGDNYRPSPRQPAINAPPQSIAPLVNEPIVEDQLAPYVQQLYPARPIYDFLGTYPSYYS